MKRKIMKLSFYTIIVALAARMVLKEKMNSKRVNHQPEEGILIGEGTKILPVVIYDER